MKKIIILSLLITSFVQGEYLLKNKINSGIELSSSITSKASCLEHYNSGSTTNGVYSIDPDGASPYPSFEVYCDMDNGGWTVISYRDVSLNNIFIYKYWNDYKNGFGDVSGQHWLGLNNIFALSKDGVQLRVETNGSEYGRYSSFRLDNESFSYKLNISGYTAGVGGSSDRLAYHNGYGFSTSDHDVDASSGNCASNYGAPNGWWFKRCYSSNPFRDIGISWYGTVNTIRFSIK